MNCIEVRTGFFVSIYSRLKRVLPEIYRDAHFDDETEKYLIPLFFMISDHYKRLRLKSAEHRTNDTKKAGLTMAAIVAMRPIAGDAATDNLKHFYANPIFALACATAIIGKPLYAGVEDEKQQLYMWLDTLRWPSTEPYLADAAAQAPQLPNSLTLTTTEISQIDMIVLKLIDLCRCIDLEQLIYDQNQEA